jgi:hypothetical protein
MVLALPRRLLGNMDTHIMQSGALKFTVACVHIMTLFLWETEGSH